MTKNRFSLQRVLAFSLKEYLQLIRDPSTMLISVVLPLFLLFLYGYGVSLDLNHLNVGILIEDQSHYASSIRRSFLNSPYFNVIEKKSREELTDALTRGAIRGFVVVPSYFTEFLQRKDIVAPIQIIADGSEPNTANFVTNYAKGAIQNFVVQERIISELTSIPQIVVEPHVWYNKGIESRYFILPGSLGIIMTLIGTLLSALVIAREWERGTMEAILSTPIKPIEILLGKFIPYFMLGMVSMLFCFAIAIGYYQVPFQGSFLAFIGISAAFLFSALSLGLMISTLARSQIIAYQISIIVGFLPAYILSGFLFEISSMPKWIQGVTYIFPVRYLVQCIQTIFLTGNVWSLFFINILPMIGVGILFFVLTLLKTKRRLL